MSRIRSKNPSISSTLSLTSATEAYKARQSQLYRDLELLLELTPSTFSSPLLALPAEIRALILSYALPDIEDITAEDDSSTSITTTLQRPELHTCLWNADMSSAEPWRLDIIGYDARVPYTMRLHPSLLLINKQLTTELQTLYMQRAKLTLHAELRNSLSEPDTFTSSPHLPCLPCLPHVTHVHLYIEWNYSVRPHDGKAAQLDDQVRMVASLLATMEALLAPMRRVESIELSILFFWKYRSGKMYPLAMTDLFELEDIMKRFAEARWLRVLHRRRLDADGAGETQRIESRRSRNAPVLTINDFDDEDEAAGVGYKLSSENKALEQSGGMEIFVAPDLEYAMRYRRQSNVDWYGNYAVSDPLPEPGFRQGAMI